VSSAVLSRITGIPENSRHCRVELGGAFNRINNRSHGARLENCRRAWHNTDMARVRVSIVFESGARIGPGKARLLESIRDTGSISAAAREMGMSYKRAWLLLDSINQAFTELLVTAAPGGAGGGGAILTAFGAEVLERYNRILDRAATNAVDDLAALARRARPEAGPKV
jgi:molybdate transport system regulatory protein